MRLFYFISNILGDLQGLRLSDEDEEQHLSPAEQRVIKAEKRAAWRQARLKSLEQVYKPRNFYNIYICIYIYQNFIK